jgi:hypothetical protein
MKALIALLLLSPLAAQKAPAPKEAPAPAARQLPSILLLSNCHFASMFPDRSTHLQPGERSTAVTAVNREIATFRHHFNRNQAHCSPSKVSPMLEL